MPIHHEGSGWQWGNHGKVYASREDAEKQAAAAHAHGFTGDAKMNAAGVVFCTPEGECLLLKRSGAGDHPGEWCFPGGGAEDGEWPIQTAQREVAEEIGDYPADVEPPTLLCDLTSDEGVAFSTFLQRVPATFACDLNEEHEDHGWFKLDALPEPLHPGVRRALDELRAQEADDCVLGDAEEQPRDEDGRFTSGAGGGSKPGRKSKASEVHKVGDIAWYKRGNGKPRQVKIREFQQSGKGEGDAFLSDPTTGHAVGSASVGMLYKEKPEEKLVQDARLTIAFDKSSVRRFDQDGRLHVAVSNISKANVCEYFGAEIAGYAELGLKEEKRYRLLRSPQALESGAATFNNIPILSEHVPISADSPRPDLVIGSTGTDAVFVSPYLRNSLVFWDRKWIDAIESGRCRELSCAYRYELEMTPGVFEGERYDGVMYNMRGNHVALVEEGRAGPDVVVGDSAIKEKEAMANKASAPALSRKAVLAKGLLIGTLTPALLAADAKPKLSDVLSQALKGVTANNWKDSKAKIVTAIKPLLANDASAAGLSKLLDSLDGEETTMDTPAVPGQTPVDEKENALAEGEGLTEDDDPVEEILGMLKPHLPPEIHTAVAGKLQSMRPSGEHGEIKPAATAGAGGPPPAGSPPPATSAQDNPPGGLGQPKPPVPEKKEDMITKPAMDAAIKAAVEASSKQIEQATISRMRAVAEAEAFVQPYVGKLAMQFDSAPAVYKAALDTLGVKTEGVHETAYRVILENLPKPNSGPRLVHDAARSVGSPEGFTDLFPEAGRIRSV